MPSILNLLFAFVLLVFFIIATFDFLHWKTFYQTFLGQVFLSIFIFFIGKRKFYITRSYLFLFYMILLGAWVSASSEFFYKLGRKENALDLFRYFCGLVPIIFFLESRKKDFPNRGIFRFLTFSILLYTSISFNYTYFRIPEIGFFLALPILLLLLKRNLDITVSRKLFFFGIILFLSFHSLLTHNSFSSLIIYANLFLATFLFLQKTRLPLGYYITILVLNFAHIFMYELETFGKFDFFQKISSPLLNTNRIANYYSLFLVLPFLYITISKIRTRNNFFIMLSICLLITFVLLNSYSRGALIGIALSVFIYIAVLFQFKKIALFGLSFTFLLQFLPVIVFLGTKFGYNFFLKYNEMSAGRIEFWNQFLEIFSSFNMQAKLIGLGVGEQNFFISYIHSNTSQIILDFVKDTDGSLIHPHSLLLSILTYFGILGIILWLWFIVLIFKKVYFAKGYFVVYSISFLIFFIHNIFDSLETTLSLIISLAHFFGFFFQRNSLTFNDSSKVFKIVFYVLGFFLLVRGYHYVEYFKTLAKQHPTWKNVRSCQFAYVPDISKINEKDKPKQNINFLAFPEFRRSQENFLYALQYYKKFPSSENYNLVEESLNVCLKHHFQPILCKFYERHKIAIILEYFEYFKEPLVYPEREAIKCFKN